MAPSNRIVGPGEDTMPEVFRLPPPNPVSPHGRRPSPFPALPGGLFLTPSPVPEVRCFVASKKSGNIERPVAPWQETLTLFITLTLTLTDSDSDSNPNS